MKKCLHDYGLICDGNFLVIYDFPKNAFVCAAEKILRRSVKKYEKSFGPRSDIKIFYQKTFRNQSKHFL